MRIIIVSGEKSGVGKTYVAQRLLHNLSRWSALKVTVSRKEGCPRGKSCGICGGIKKPFYIIKDRKILNQAGKDTARLKESGAKEVIWLKARPEGLREGLSRALGAFSDCEGVVIEGTSVLKFIQPDMHIHVRSKGNYTLCTQTPIAAR